MEKDQKPNSETQNNEAEESKSDELNNDTQTTNEENNEQIKEASPEEKIIELEDKLARSFAEMENQRRRFEKERDDAFNYGGFTFAKETLNLIDNFERSKQILENDDTLKNSEALKKTLEHFDIINKDMVSILSKNGITPIDSIGKKLDPNLHQAMMEIDDDQKEPGTIVQEIQKGFMMKDRLLRPALVGVSKKTKIQNDDVLKNSEALKKTLEHFDIINKDMVSILSKNGITPVISIGKKLDPNQHQAMMEIDDDQKEPGTIIQEIQKGFMMKDRLLRPALVGVSKKTKIQNDQKSEENEENSSN